MATALSLKSLLVPSKTVEVEFPGLPGFKVNVSFLSRETLVAIRKKSTKTSFKSNNRQLQEELDDKLFLQHYVEASVKGWTGLTLAYLEQLSPVDLSGQDLEAELEFSTDNALALMQSSSSFDSFISETVTDLSNFSKSSSSK
jgi:hypothetical protein